nr:maltase-glucoamylase, intestinal-like [Oncorhynchus nerka]
MVNGLPEAERLTLGVVNVWGVGSVSVTEVTLRYLSGSVKQVTFQHNTSTKVLIADATDLSVRVDQGFTLTWKTNT